MKLKTIGFYRELRHGFKDGESILKQVNKNALENEIRVIEYLDSGKILCVSPGLIYDILDEQKEIIGSLDIRTDGIWAWPSDLSYYVKKYHLTLNNEFVIHMMKNDWIIPNKIDMSILELP